MLSISKKKKGYRAKNRTISTTFVQENTHGARNRSCLRFLAENKNASFLKGNKNTEIRNISVRKCWKKFWTLHAFLRL